MKYMTKSIEELHALLKEGKVTSKELIKRMENVESLPSYTDRSPREGEVPGTVYNFVTTEEFEEMMAIYKAVLGSLERGEAERKARQAKKLQEIAK